MAEYIEREALITKFKKMGLGEHGLVERLFADGVYTVIAAFPAADVAPVRHGHWYNRGGHFRCSVCNNKTLLKDIGGTGGWSHEYEQQKSPYCPTCGAKMDGGDNNG